jgi:thiol-disulfide isomerase/thioredoxin
MRYVLILGGFLLANVVGCSAAVDPSVPPVVPRRAVVVPDSSEAAGELAAEEGVSAPWAPGWLGVALSGREPREPGVVISSVMRGSPAAVQGLRVGDVVLGINDGGVTDPGEMSRRIAALGAGARANLMLERDGQHHLLAVELGQNPGPEGQLRLGFVDAPAPELEGVEVARGGVGPTLQSLRGRVVVLEFWATWCGACRALLPTLNEWHERLEASGGLVLSVTIDPVLDAARDAAELGLRYPVLADPAGATTQTYQAYALPTLFVIDRDGVVRDVTVGYDPDRIAQIEATLARLVSGG